eukprot:g35274.t1
MEREAFVRTFQPRTLWWWPPGRQGKFKEAANYFRALIARQLSYGKKKGTANFCTTMAQRRTLNGQNLFTDDEIFEEALTLHAAGHETTGNTLAWALWLLAQHPQVMENVVTEVMANVKSNVPTWEESRTLAYTTSVVLEVLRIFPTVPHFARLAANDTQVGPYFIPKGSTVIISQLFMNHNSKLWGPDADTFKPERFASISLQMPKQSKPIGVPGKDNQIYASYFHTNFKKLKQAKSFEFRADPSIDYKVSKSYSTKLEIFIALL